MKQSLPIQVSSYRPLTFFQYTDRRRPCHLAGNRRCCYAVGSCSPCMENESARHKLFVLVQQLGGKFVQHVRKRVYVLLDALKLKSEHASHRYRHGEGLSRSECQGRSGAFCSALSLQIFVPIPHRASSRRTIWECLLLVGHWLIVSSSLKTRRAPASGELRAITSSISIGLSASSQNVEHHGETQSLQAVSGEEPTYVHLHLSFEERGTNSHVCW